MIVGVGIDLVEVYRVEESIDKYKSKFLNRLFTKAEQKYCNRFSTPYEHFAARFAAKEAVSKALGIGFGEELSWLDIEIQNDAKGKPSVVLSKKVANKFSNPKIHISLSHTKDHAIAYVVLEN